MSAYDASKIIVISYPAGGFGYFIYHVLTDHADGTYKVDNSQFDFDNLGTSHRTQTYTNTWHLNPAEYEVRLPDTDKYCLIVCDNSFLNDQYDRVWQVIGQCRVVRVCISEPVRSAYWNTCAYKSISSTPEDMMQDHVSAHWPNANEDWAKRENITLHYHNWNYGWRPMNHHLVTNIEYQYIMLKPFEAFCGLITDLGFSVVDADKLQHLCQRWHAANKKYFQIYYDWQQIEQALDSQTDYDMSSITTLNDQGYINYCIEKKYNVTIPVYDYRHWFKSTKDIIAMLSKIT